MTEGFTPQEIAQTQLMQELGISPQYMEIQEKELDISFLQQLDPEKINEYIENKLRNRVWDREKKKWIDNPNVKKRITEEGINEIMTRVWSIINPNTVYSNLNEEIIVNIVIDFAKELSRFLSLKYKDFGMEVIDINKITNFCSNMAYIALMRGLDALTLRLLRTMIQSREITTSTKLPQEQKKSLLNPLNWFRR